MTSNSCTTSSGGTTTTTTTTSGGGGPCGTCKFLRRKCVASCIFTPYFDSEQGAAHFAAVYKVFGASNVSKLLHHVSAHKRLNAVITICYEVQACRRDPVYGCVAHIFALHQQHFCSTTSSTSTTSVTSSTSATTVTSFGSTANVRGSNAIDGLMLQTSATGFQNF